jgi:hypothetical protein
MNSMARKDTRNIKRKEKPKEEPYVPPEIREVWDESVGTVGLFLLEM